MAEPHVRLVGVTKRFGSNAAAVDNVSLDVPRGSFTTFLGPSGCGKTTTLRMIAGFYEPDTGDILLGDRRINDVPAHRRSTAMVFQDYALFPHMSVADNVAYGLKLARVPREEMSKRVADTLRFLGLSGLEQRSPNQLSGGQQQRVALARALVMNPEVLLLDEPLSNLDAKLRVSIRAELISIQRHLGITTIYVTHDQEEALAMSDWVAVMNRGQVVQWGTPWEIYYQPRTEFMADFVGTVNLMTFPILERAPGGVRVRLDGSPDGHSAFIEAADAPPGEAARVAVRPESLTVVPLNADPGALMALQGQIVRKTFLGHLMRYTVRIGEHEWLVDQPDPGASAPLDGDVHVLFNPRRAHVVHPD
ncbi:MAG: ABC transporter ATP-binding protein [Chloroflexota bacterium]